MMDDPFSLLGIALWTLAAGMYPLGFMLGASCSPCCNACRNDTCEGFDIEEAFSCRGGGASFCPEFTAWEFVSDFTYLGDGVFAFGRAVPGGYTLEEDPNAFVDAERGVDEGCWVSGDGIAFGTRVVDGSRELLNDWTLGGKKGCCRFERVFSNGVVQQRQGLTTEDGCQAAFDNVQFGVLRHQNYSWNECEVCSGDLNSFFANVLPEIISPKRYTGRYLVTVDPPPESVSGCVTFCGGSGLCGPMPRHPDQDEFGAGPFGADVANNYGGVGADNMRRMCVRWLCRCYEGTGKKNQFVEEINPETGVGYTPEEGGPYFTGEHVFPDPYDWYTVESTTEVGGPVVFGGTLAEKLEAATSNYYGYEKFEHDWVFGDPNEWQAAEGDRFCIVYRFVFYGTSKDPPSSGIYESDTAALRAICELENPDEKFRPGKTVTPKDVWTLSACDRCSCQ